MNAPNTVLLHALAHARTGDKGNRSSISLIAYDPARWQLLVEQVELLLLRQVKVEGAHTN